MTSVTLSGLMPTHTLSSTMRRKEKERLARRAAYQHARQMAAPTKIYVPYGMSVEEFDRLSDFNTAFHEAGHAIAAWIQGCRASMRYIPKGELTNGCDFNAVTTHDPSFEKFLSKPAVGALKFTRGIITDSTGATVGIIDDGGVLARQQVFITLAGPFAEMSGRETGLPESVYQVMIKEHGIQAQSKLHFTRESHEELKSVFNRLVELVAYTFSLPPVQHCVKVLAEKFHKARSLSEEEVSETIRTAWNEAARAVAAKAGS